MNIALFFEKVNKWQEKRSLNAIKFKDPEKSRNYLKAIEI